MLMTLPWGDSLDEIQNIQVLLHNIVLKILESLNTS